MRRLFLRLLVRLLRLLGACPVVVQGDDGGLDLVAAGALNAQRRLQDAHAVGDLVGVPQAAVLSVERDDATPLSRVAPGGGRG